MGRGVMNILKAAPGLLIPLNQDGRVNSVAAPASRGQVLELYATGLGDSAPVVADGDSGPALPPAIAAELPQVSFGGVAATPYYAALAPGLVGVWRVNVVIPANAPTGDTVGVTMRQGLASNSLAVALQ